MMTDQVQPKLTYTYEIHFISECSFLEASMQGRNIPITTAQTAN